jgi:hypothetical protein
MYPQTPLSAVDLDEGDDFIQLGHDLLANPSSFV